MAGTTTKSRDNSGLTSGSRRDAVIHLNKLVDDVELVRKQVSEFVGSATWNPGSLADGVGETSAAITVTGAALGDFVTGVSFSLDLQGLTLTAYVDATDSVKARLQNESAATVDLASGTIRVMVASHSLAAADTDLTAAKVGNPAGTAISA